MTTLRHATNPLNPELPELDQYHMELLHILKGHRPPLIFFIRSITLLLNKINILNHSCQEGR